MKLNMLRFFASFAILTVFSACATTGAKEARMARAEAQLKAEIHYTRAKYPAFELYLIPTIRYLAVYPDLLVEAAYCAVSQEASDSCQDALKTIPVEARPAIPKGAIKVLIEKTKDTYVPLLDVDTGLPIFEFGNAKYTAFGPVGSKAPQQSKQRPGFVEFMNKSYAFREAYGPSQTNGIKPMGPIKIDAYGPGLHSDATGRSFTFRTQDGQKTYGPVQLDGYGLGVHTDQYGRPVYAIPGD